MTDEEFLARWDARLAIDREHLARSNELHARGNELMEENRKANADLLAEVLAVSEKTRNTFAEIIAGARKAAEENREAFAEVRHDLKDVRFELSQMNMRGERVANNFIAILKDLHDGSVAQREALFRIIDNLRGDGPAAAGA